MTRTCAGCERPPAPRSKWCEEACRKRYARAHKGQVSPIGVRSDAPDTADGSESTLVAQVRSDLELAGVLTTSLGQMALDAASRVARSHDTGSSYASLLREARTVLAEALRAGRQPDSAVQSLQDELAARRMA